MSVIHNPGQSKHELGVAACCTNLKFLYGGWNNTVQTYDPSPTQRGKKSGKHGKRNSFYKLYMTYISVNVDPCSQWSPMQKIRDCKQSWLNFVPLSPGPVCSSLSRTWTRKSSRSMDLEHHATSASKDTGESKTRFLNDNLCLLEVQNGSSTAL